MDNLDLNEIFGLDSDTGAEEQDVADPAAEEDEEIGQEGEEAQETADPASVDDESADARRGTTEEDSRYAAARRRAEAERDAYVERARQEERARANELVKSLGISNPMASGSKFETLEDIERYRGELQQRRLQQGIRNGTASTEDIAAGVMQSKAMQPLVQLQRQMEARQQAEQQQAARKRIEADVAEIGRLDPDIKSIEDIRGLPEFPQLMERVRRGDTLPEAYRLVYFEKLTGRQARAAEQAVRNRDAGKRHLQPVATRGNGAVEVDRETIEEYRKLMPDATDKEIRDYHAKYMRSRK